MIEFEVTLAQLQPPGTLEMDKIGVFLSFYQDNW